MNDLLIEHFGAILGAFGTAWVGFLFGKGKLKAEVAGMDADNEGKEIENADKLVKLYKEAIDDLGSRYEVKFKEVIAMYDSKVKLLEDETNLHKSIIAQLKEENTMLHQKIKDSGIIL